MTQLRVTIVLINIKIQNMFKFFILTLFLHNKFITSEATPLPNDDPENLPELKEDTSITDDKTTEDEGWLARIVPEIPNLQRIVPEIPNIQLSDYLKPWTVQIPLLSFPDMPSYSISFAKK